MNHKEKYMEFVEREYQLGINMGVSFISMHRQRKAKRAVWPLIEPLLKTLEKYTDQETYRGARVGDYVPVSIAMKTLAEFEKAIGGEDE